MTVVPITSSDLMAAEVSWFSALCSDDYQFLGIPDGNLRSSWEHCSSIVKEAENYGFRNILCPSSYQVGQDTLSFVAGCAPITEKINMLAAVRCGEMQPIMLARTIATLDHMMNGRLTINIISSDFPGEKAESGYRYQRSREVVEILKQAWTQDEIDYEGEIYKFSGLTTEPSKPFQVGGPLLYFGGYSHYGLRVHMIVRDTEAEAKEYAEYIVSKLEDDFGKKIRERAQDSSSLGVSHQAKNRKIADEFGYVEPHLWTGVGRARSGCGAAIVGSTDQVMSELEQYQKLGIRSFILSGYPHLDECKHFGSKVLPNIKTCSLPHEYGRVPESIPSTPLGLGERH